MATYHCSVKVMKRSAGRSATAAAAYRHGTRIEDEREGRVHDYTRKQHVDASFILSPENAPGWTRVRSSLWNRVELTEKRQDAQVAREVEVALPREVPKKVQEQLVRDFVNENFIALGMIADVAIHRPSASDGKEQPHAHIMLTMRPLDGDHFAKKKDRSWNEKKLVEKWRASWAGHVNSAYETARLDKCVDHRSFERQGTKQAPTVHLGPVNHAMEMRGIRTPKGDHNRVVARLNLAFKRAKEKLQELTEAARKVVSEKAAIRDSLVYLDNLLRQRELDKARDKEKALKKKSQLQKNKDRGRDGR